MDALSAKRWMEIKRAADIVYKEKIDADTSEAISKLEQPYCIEVNFRNITDPSIKKACNELPTSFYLCEKQLALIDTVVPSLLNNDPDMQRLVTNQCNI